jgi:hypothetical protein
MDNNTDINVVREWDFQVNLSGIQAPTGGAGNALPAGFYKFMVTDMYVNPEKNPNRVVIKLAVAEGPFKGTIRTSGLNRPGSADDNVRYYWRGFAESVGYEPAQLDNGEISLGLGAFKDRIATAKYTPKDEEAGVQYEDVSFLPPTAWADQKANFDANGGAPAPAVKSNGASAAVITPAASATPAALGGTASKASILGRLGVS